jgi:hypothetical protein
MTVFVDHLKAQGDEENLKRFLHIYKANGLHDVQIPGRVLERLQQHRMPVNPQSSLGQHVDVDADGTISLEAFIRSQGWYVPEDIEAAHNLYQVLTMPVPRLNENNRYLEVLSMHSVWSFTDVQRNVIEDAIGSWFSSRPGFAESGGLLKYLLDASGDIDDVTTAVQRRVERLMASAATQQLGIYLHAELKDISFVENPGEWCMIAILLTLHPDEVSPGHIGGYQVAQKNNWGMPVTTIVKDVERYLENIGNFEPHLAKVATFLAMAGVAPGLTAYDLPEDLVYGSTAWALFNATALRLDKEVPGICAAMSVGQIMSVAALRPITALQDSYSQDAWRSTLIQWGLMNGIVGQKSDEEYDAYIEEIREVYNQQVLEQAECILHCNALMPTRKALAEWELIGLFASDTGVNEQDPIYRELGGANVKKSLVEIYMDGWVPGKKITSGIKGDPLDGVADRLDTLPRIESLFDQAFTPYVDNLRSGFSVIVKNLLSQLPLEERRCLETGDVTVYSMHCGFAHSAFENYAARVAQLTWHHGVLLRVAGGWGVNYYEVIPGAGLIKKNIDLPADIETGYVRRGGAIGDTEINGYYGRGYKFYSSDYVYTLATADKGHDSGPRYGIILEILEHDRADHVWELPPIDSTAEGPYTYSTRTTNYIAQIVARHLVGPEDALKRAAWGLTRLDERDLEEKKWREFALAFVPFYSAIKNFINGNIALGLFYASLDVFGFMLGKTSNVFVIGLIRSAVGKGSLKTLASLAQAPALKRLENSGG